MAEGSRPVFYPRLGEYFQGLRATHGWNQKQAAEIAQRRGLHLTLPVLRRIELGITKNPKPAVLEALAALYKLSYDDLVNRFRDEQYGGGAAQSAGPDATLTQQLAFVIAQRDRYRQALKKVSTIASELLGETE
jgi:transcriptional regulator with XRE-family HTH domain